MGKPSYQYEIRKNQALLPFLEHSEFVQATHIEQLEQEIFATLNHWYQDSTPKVLPLIVAYFEGCFLNRTIPTKNHEALRKFLAKLMKVTKHQDKNISLKVENSHTFIAVYTELMTGNYPKAFAQATKLRSKTKNSNSGSKILNSALVAEAYHRFGRTTEAIQLWQQVEKLDSDLQYFSAWGLPYISALSGLYRPRELSAIGDKILGNKRSNQYAMQIANWFRIKKSIYSIIDSEQATTKKVHKSDYSHPLVQLELWAKHLSKPNKKSKKFLLRPDCIRKYSTTTTLAWQICRSGANILRQIVDLLELPNDAQFKIERVTKCLDKTHLFPTKELSEKFQRVLIAQLNLGV